MPAGVERQFLSFSLLVSGSLEARSSKLEAVVRDEQVGAIGLLGAVRSDLQCNE